MSDVELTDKMSLEELQKTEEYIRLTPKQQLWVSTYIQNGMEHGDYNPILATKLAFSCQTDESARTMSYSLMYNIHIVEVLNLHFRTEPIDAFLKLIDRAINNKKITHAQVELLRLKCEILGLKNRLPVYNGEEGGVRLPEGVENVPAVSIDPENRRPQTRKPGRKPRKNLENSGKKPPQTNSTGYEF